MFEKLREICEINGASGDESRVREYILSRINADSVTVDRLGNILAFKKGGKTPKNKIMFAAHTDEVGFMITDITDDGFLKFGAVGWINPAVIPGRGFRLGNGERAVCSTKAVHRQSDEERKQFPEISELFLDIGAASREEAEKRVNLGDYAYFDSDFFEFGDGFVKGKALDDRAGCLALIEMINSDLEYDAWFAFTVQEEVGTRGASAAAFQIEPDIAFVLETTTACDIAGVSGAKRVCELGKGAVVTFMDNGTLYDRELYRLAMKTASENSIPAQTKTLIAGGNDARAISSSRGGVRVCAISVPTRYLHSPSCVFKLSDFEAVKALSLRMLSAAAEL